ncbi:nuclear transport factor 2 family protein [Qipengyuania sediminis]|uniref:nuclear transport factor 2 family protein n=1 Tax=Qipengyuania sediminis TaxID=1532023 RepID=UPI00105921D4|nr:nuclear transport factor 2 family protein [Qipengyuania sediminis]
MFGLGRRSGKRIVRRYVACLNARDLNGVAALLHPDCRFIDSHGEWIEGRDAIIAATQRFFAIEPRFRMRLDSVVDHGGEILIRGEALASRPEFTADALWCSRVEEGKVVFWQSFGPQTSPRLARILSGQAAETAQHRAQELR